MKFNVNSGELVKSLSAVIGAVPAKATLPILETVLFETENSRIKISATDLEVSIIEHLHADVESEGSVAIPGRRLLETLRQLPDIPVTFDVDDRAQVKFRTDKGTYKLAGEQSEDFPDMPVLVEGTRIRTDAKGIKDAIRKTSFAVSSDDLRPAMMGVFFDIGEKESRIAATDGHRLVRLVRQDISASTPISFIVPEKALSLAAKAMDAAECEMVVTTEHVSFQSGDTRVITRLINEQYPKYESVIPRENDKTLKISREQLLSTVRRVSVYSSSSTRQIRIELKADEIIVSAEDLDMSSEARESISSEYADEPMEIGFNARYLMDVLNNIDDPEVIFEFSTPNRAGIVRPSEQDEDEDMLMLVMPVMLNSYI